ncbi:MAG: nitrate/sulfonate/bicarbonate ABC transporter ATP-binding protein [Alphaproteobacteria bacterium]|nr:MAG: nitrate/sulfonate/bicarbonate ABC transporter ATP-binding protein [Alphaproteobacteria bacterium]
MLRIDHLHKRFDDGFLALSGVNLTVERGEILSLVGTSGCGKSTLLRIVGGLEHPTVGEVRIDDELVRAPRPEIGIVFQEPRLMPWLSVAENVKFGIDTLPRERQAELAAEALAKVGLADAAGLLPRQLSGGMAQRVAIARALVTRPEILLLDEPFSALDAFTRLNLQDHLLQSWAYDRPTMIFVTHDIDEALVLSDRVIVMRGQPGRIHREYALELDRPRRRTDLAFQQWKERILGDLDLSGEM